jgi:hypothetical protein
MTYQQLLAVLARDELGHLRREKSRQLGTLPLDGGEQTRVRKHDRRLIGERLHQHDLLVGEPLRFAPNHDDHADHVVVEQNRHPEKARYGIGPEYAYSVSSRISGMFTGGGSRPSDRQLSSGLADEDASDRMQQHPLRHDEPPRARVHAQAPTMRPNQHCKGADRPRRPPRGPAASLLQYADGRLLLALRLVEPTLRADPGCTAPCPFIATFVVGSCGCRKARTAGLAA